MALVLTLSYDDFLFIGDDISVVVKKKKNGSGVTVLIEAPRDIKINHLRGVKQRLAKEKACSGKT